MAQQDHNGVNRLVKPETTAFWVRVLYVVCALLFLVGLGYQFLTEAWDKAHFGFESWPGFYGVYGFVVFVFIVYAGKWLRRVVKRDEDYYEPDEPERSR